MITRILATPTLLALSEPKLPKVPKVDKAGAAAAKAESISKKALDFDNDTAATILKVLMVVLVLFLVAIVLYFLLGFLLRKLRAYRAKAAMQRELDQSTQDPSPQKPNESELQTAFDQTITEIGSSKKGERALHLMPWYLVMGPQGSGKSSVLRHSGLEYPYLEGSQRGIPELRSGPTEHCDCWVSDQGVFLDLAGKYAEPGAEPKAWSGFLTGIAKLRQGTPLNGIVLTLSLETFLSRDGQQGKSQSEQHELGRNLRNAIDRVYSMLGYRLPVYVLISQCDRTEGFSELMTTLPASEKRAPLGITLPMFDAPRELSSHLAVKLDALNDQLYEHVARQIARASNHQDTQSLFAFPQNFSRHKASILAFAGALTHNAGRTESLLLRGVYFASALQEQNALDHLLRSRGRGSLRGVSDEAVEQESSGIFLEGLFSQVLFPDRAFSQETPTAKEERFRHRLMWSTGISTAALAVLLLPWNAASRYKSLEQEAIEQVRDLNSAERPLARYTSKSAIETYQSLAKLESRVEEPREVRIAGLAWGMSNDSQFKPAYTAFVDRAVDQWAQAWVRNIVERDAAHLARVQGRYANQHAALRGKELQDTYNALGRYLLLTDVRGSHHRTPEQRVWLEAQLSSEKQELEKLHRKNKPRLTKDSGMAGRLTQAILGNERLRVPGKRNVKILAQKLLADVERVQIPRFVSQLVVKANSDNRDQRFQLKSFTDKVSRSFLKVTREPTFVPAAFNKHVWEDVIRPELHEEAKLPAYLAQGKAKTIPPLWIRGLESEDAWHAKREEALQKAYVTQYEDAWRGFLNSLDITGLGSDETAILTMLESLGDAGASPYYELFETVRDNAWLPHAGNAETDEPSSTGFAITKLQEFAKYGAVAVGEKPERSLPLDTFTARVAELHNAMLTQKESASGAKDFRALHKRIRRQVRQMVTEQSDAWNEVLGKLMNKPIDATYAHATQRRSGSLQDQWCNNVVAVYKRQFENRYPFQRNDGGAEVDLVQLTNFFHPTNGNLWAAVSSFEDLVTRQGEQYKAVQREREQKRINPAMLEFLTQSRLLSNSLFPPNSAGPSIPFSVKAMPRSGLQSIELLFGDRSMVYQNGPSIPEHLNWPAKGDDQGATLNASYSPYGVEASASIKAKDRGRALPAGSTVSPNFHRPEKGAWALFKLLDSQNASVDEVNENDFTVSWTSIRNRSAPRIVLHFNVPGGVTPFFGDSRKSSSLMQLFRSSKMRIPRALFIGPNQEGPACPGL